jgi:hypothetical protein
MTKAVEAKTGVEIGLSQPRQPVLPDCQRRLVKVEWKLTSDGGHSTRFTGPGQSNQASSGIALSSPVFNLLSERFAVGVLRHTGATRAA